MFWCFVVDDFWLVVFVLFVFAFDVVVCYVCYELVD